MNKDKKKETEQKIVDIINQYSEKILHGEFFCNFEHMKDGYYIYMYPGQLKWVKK